ncbi:MAG TPA: prolyl oligopeptidase family serine peptidase [Gemmataceae bacterium]|nr:prolyl oligopeptidase family serine peptidase [Gemmataceae bacterium]
MAVNGAGVVVFVSAEYRSGRGLLDRFGPAIVPLVGRGYTVFAVVHGSQPRYTVPDIVEDAHRAVRFVRHSARRYGVDPERLGAGGGSAGGHLALMVGCAGRPGDPGAKDPVDRESSKANAVACFFPPTDFVALENRLTADDAAAFDFRELDPRSGTLERVGADRRREIARGLSPVTHAGKGSAPVFIMHGDKDERVPIEQSKALVARLKGCGVACELEVKPGAGHGWRTLASDVPRLADWFDAHLPRGEPGRGPAATSMTVTWVIATHSPAGAGAGGPGEVGGSVGGAVVGVASVVQWAPVGGGTWGPGRGGDQRTAGESHDQDGGGPGRRGTTEHGGPLGWRLWVIDPPPDHPLRGPLTARRVFSTHARPPGGRGVDSGDPDRIPAIPGFFRWTTVRPAVRSRSGSTSSRPATRPRVRPGHRVRTRPR